MNAAPAALAIDPFPARALADLLDRPGKTGEGDALPLPWRWLYFLDAPARAATGADGHPLRGGFLPPVPLPLRMWAAGRLQVQAHGAKGIYHLQHRPERRQNRAASVCDGGPSGEPGRTHLHRRGTEHRLPRCTHHVRAVAVGGERACSARLVRTLLLDTALLFRFSALTYNGHRIHFDRDCATQVEFYPSLVVHDPLLATPLLDLVQREQPGAAIKGFSFREIRPAFEGQTMRACGTPTASSAELWTSDAEGFTGMKASAAFA